MSFSDTCIKGDVKHAKYMIENDKDYIDLNYGLSCACRYGHEDLANLLIEKGACDLEYGLITACYYGKDRLVEFMIEKGAKDFDRGLQNACLTGQVNIVKLMIEKGATEFTKSLQNICFKMFSENTKKLFNKKLNITRTSSDIEIIILLIKNGAEINDNIEYPKDKIIISELLNSGFALEKFKYISGYNLLCSDIQSNRKCVKDNLNDYIIADLGNIVAQYICL